MSRYDTGPPCSSRAVDAFLRMGMASPGGCSWGLTTLASRAMQAFPERFSWWIWRNVHGSALWIRGTAYETGLEECHAVRFFHGSHSCIVEEQQQDAAHRMRNSSNHFEPGHGEPDSVPSRRRRHQKNQLREKSHCSTQEPTRTSLTCISSTNKPGTYIK